MVEGCPDALAIVQEAGDLVAVVAAGSTTGGRLERWIGRLRLASLALIGFDADEGGDTAAAWWLRALRERGKRWRPYWDDPNAMLQAGTDLRTWIREGLALQPPWWLELARWPDVWREHWSERAAIMEIDGGLSRDAAEQQAVLAVQPMVLCPPMTGEGEPSTKLDTSPRGDIVGIGTLGTLNWDSQGHSPTAQG